MRARTILELTLAALLLAVALAPSRWGVPLAALALVVLLRAARGRSRRDRRRAEGLLVLGALLELVAGAAGGIPALRLEGAEARLRASHAEFWQEFEADADRAAAALAEPVEGEDLRRELFRRLARAARESSAPDSRTLLLFDAAGDLEAWRGPALLEQERYPLRAGGGIGVERAERSVTPYVAREVEIRTGAAWRLVVGESFSLDDSPPVERADRARWRVARWDLVPGGADGRPRLELSGPVDERPIVRGRDVERAGALAIGIGFAAVGAAAAARAARRRRVAVRRADGMVPLALPGAAAACAVGAGAGTAEALLAAAGVAIAVLGVVRGRRPGGVWTLLPALLAGPLLLAAFAFAPLREPALSESLWGSGAAVALRLAAAAAVFGACALGAGWRPRSRVRARAADRALAVAALAALAAIVVVDRPGMVALLLAAGGLATAASFAFRPGASPLVAASLMLALALAAGAGSAGEWIALRLASAARLDSLLPPADPAMDALGAEIERALAELGHGRLPSSEEVDAAGVASDLAYALWRDSPLARADLLSALTVVSPGGSRESFSYGLPIDGRGAIDASAVRWVDLAPTAWRQRSRAGEVSIHGRVEEPWRLRWAFVPRIGFAHAEARAIDEPRRGVARAGRSLTLLPELPRPVRAAIYGLERRPIATSWLEGTPPFDEAWATASAPFHARVLTPDGVARVAGRRQEALAAALYVPIPSPFGALERGGVFVAGALLAALGVGLAALALALPRRLVRAAARRTLRSYSRRLVLVVSACLLVPVVAIYGLVARSLELRLERQQEAAALDALRSAQRVLGEYVLSLEPGFGVGTALDDRLLEWLARVIRNEIHLYWGSEVYASSKRDLFAAGLLPRRIPGDAWEKIHLAGERVARRITRSGAGEYQEIYAPLEIPGLSADSTKLVLALPLLGRQEELTAEIAAARRRALLATLAVATLVLAVGTVAARRFTRPIEEIVAGTRRIAEGAELLGYRPEETELVALAEAIDRMAQRIADARRRLLVEKRLVERIVENVTAAVVGLDREGRVLFANRLARSLVGAAPGEDLSASLEARGLGTAARALARAAAAGEPTAARVTIDDSDRDWTLVRVPLPGSGEPSEIVVVEDVTDVVRAQRLDAWAAMARIIAHEIKNPLTPIRLSTEHLKEAWQRDREHFSAVFERCTANILEQVEELRRTASEFSLYSEIPRIEPVRGDLREAVAEVVEGYRAGPVGAASVELRAPESPVPADFDKRMLGRAVRNLIENAVRASANGGAVEVVVEPADGQAVVRVADRGPGVPAELLGRVLEPYFSTHSGGTGLGLPIARRVAEEHGGSLAVRNRPSGGFEVTIRIPLR